jgi:hypothetical protein
MATEDGDDAISGRLMVARAMLDSLAAERDEAVHWTGAAVRCHRRTADVGTLLSTISTHAHMLTVADRGPAARAFVAEGLELAAGYPDPRFRDQLEGTLAFAAVIERNYDEAEERLQAILARPERTDFAAHGAMSYLADCALGRGDAQAALRRYAAALQVELRNTDENNAVLQLIGIATSLATLGRDSEAATMFGAVERFSARIGMNRASMLDQGGVPELVQRLGAGEFERLRARGGELTVDQAAELAYQFAGRDRIDAPSR